MENTSDTQEIGFNTTLSPELSAFLRSAIKATVEQVCKDMRISPKTRKRTISLHGAWELYRTGNGRHLSKDEIVSAIESGQVDGHKTKTGRYVIDMDSLEIYFKLK